MITEYTGFCLSGGWDDGPGLCKRGKENKVELRVASAISESGVNLPYRLLLLSSFLLSVFKSPPHL